MARDLVRAGIPVFVAEPCSATCTKRGHKPGKGAGDTGYHIPYKWETSMPTLGVVDRWKPGWALAAVGGHGADFLDTDPRNGGLASASSLKASGAWPESYGRASTPSEGEHDIIAPLRVGKGKPADGIDLQGGMPDGSSRGFVFISPTVRPSRLDGQPRPYRWMRKPDLDKLVESVDTDDSGNTIATMLINRGPRVNGSRPGGSPDDPFHSPGMFLGRTKESAQRLLAEKVAEYEELTGEGNDRVNRMNNLALLAGHGVPAFWSAEAVANRLREAAKRNGVLQLHGEFSIQTQIRNGLAKGAQEPWEVLDDPPAGAPVSGAETASTSEDAVEDAVSTWEPEDLEDILDGSYVPEKPELFPREDGPSLLYRRRVHSFHGESESGKSMLAQIECARILKAGGTAAYIDFESDKATVVPRLLMMGATPDDIRARFQYRRPDARPTAGTTDGAAYTAMLGQEFDIVVVDGVTESMGVFGVESSDNKDEVSKWVRWFPRRLATATGAAVVLIDHVAKDEESRGRFAIGSQAKMSALDGAAYTIEVRKPLGRGMSGAVSMRVGKDRPGSVRPECGEFRAKDRTQEAAYVVVDSTVPNTIRVEVRAPQAAQDPEKQLMVRVSMELEGRMEPMTQNEIVTAVTGNARKIRHACNELIKEGFVRLEKVGQRQLHVSIKPYRIATAVECTFDTDEDAA